MDILLAESENYQISSFYEVVSLKSKKTEKKVCIGDFYGDPEGALISKDEKYCVMWGAGVIIYYLNEPFEEYKYNTQSKQWKEWGRETADSTIWVDEINCIDSNHIEPIDENRQKFILDVY